TGAADGPAAVDGDAAELATVAAVRDAAAELATVAAGGDAAAELATLAAGGVAVAAVAAPFASLSMTAITSCPATVAPSPFRTSTSTPATGAGNSSTTLSVSTSTRFSSRSTGWPAFLCQLTSVASAIPSGSCGTLTSTRMR